MKEPLLPHLNKTPKNPMAKKHLLIAFAAVLVSGCGKSPIDMVKNTYLDGARTTTVANALSNRPLCGSTKWETYTDDKGRAVVEYLCDFVGGNDFNGERRANYIAKQTKDYSGFLASERKRMEDAQERLHEDFPETKEQIQKIDAAENRTNEAIALQGASGSSQKTQRMLALEGTLKKLEGYSGPYNEQRMLELYLSNALKEEGFGAATIEVKMAYMNRLPPEKRANFKANEIDTPLKRLHSSLNSVRKRIAQDIEREARNAEWESRQAGQRRLDVLQRMKAQRADLVSHLESKRESARQAMASAESDIKKLEEEGSKEKIERDALIKFPVYNGAAEIFQWVVNKHGEATLVYGEIQTVVSKGKTETFLKYNRPGTVLARVMQSEAKEMMEYVDEMRGYAIVDMLTR